MKNITVDKLKSGVLLQNSFGDHFVYIGVDNTGLHVVKDIVEGTYKAFSIDEMFEMPQSCVGYVLVFRDEAGKVEFGDNVLFDEQKVKNVQW